MINTDLDKNPNEPLSPTADLSAYTAAICSGVQHKACYNLRGCLFEIIDNLEHTRRVSELPHGIEADIDDTILILNECAKQLNIAQQNMHDITLNILKG